MFITDRDLLVLEPNVFRDAGWIGQRPLQGTGSVSGTNLTLTAGSFTTAGVAPGHVLLYDALALEVVSVTSATVAVVSLLRAQASDAALPPPALGSKPVTCWTFRPQAFLMHSQMLRMLGIEPEAAPDSMVCEASIVNPQALALAEALGTLHLVYAAASALSPADSALPARAMMYRQRFEEERRRAIARLDLDGDGQADCTRRLNILQLARA
jgi:hypothetical protein